MSLHTVILHVKTGFRLSEGDPKTRESRFSLHFQRFTFQIDAKYRPHSASNTV